MTSFSQLSRLYALLRTFLLIFPFGVAGVAQAQPIIATEGKSSKQTMSSGKNTYRVELRGLTEFEVLATGDSDGEGELFQIEVSLRGRNLQRDVSNQTSPFFTNVTTGHYGNNSYLEVKKGDYVRYGGRTTRRDENHDLWIHARKSDRAYKAVIDIIVKAAELDCAFTNVCSDGHTGAYVKSFDIPIFDKPPPNTCGPSNMFRLVKRNNYLHLDGIDGDRQYFYVGDRDEAYLKKTNGPSNDGIVLRPTNAWICIASTYKPKPAPPFSIENKNYPTRTRLLRNIGKNLCLASIVFQDEKVTPMQCAFDTEYEWSHRSQANQIWKIKHVPDEESIVVIQSADGTSSGAHSKCLGVPDGVVEANIKVTMLPCTYKHNLRWRIWRIPGSRNGYNSDENYIVTKKKIIHVESGLCLHLKDKRTQDGLTFRVLRLNSCNSNSVGSQQWETIDEEGANYRNENRQ